MGRRLTDERGGHAEKAGAEEESPSLSQTHPLLSLFVSLSLTQFVENTVTSAHPENFVFYISFFGRGVKGQEREILSNADLCCSSKGDHQEGVVRCSRRVLGDWMERARSRSRGD